MIAETLATAASLDAACRIIGLDDCAAREARVPWGMLSRAMLLAALPLCFGMIQAPAATPPRPNIVLILADDMGFSDLGCFGSEIETPNLDRLASNGLRMTQFYTTPRCCPTRAALLTGVYPQQAGIGNMMEDRGLPGYRGELSHDCITIAEELKAAGYRTSMLGKWHVSHIYFDGKKQLDRQSNVPFWDNKDDWPRQRGFEHFFGTIHGVCSYYDPFSLAAENTPVNPDRPDFYYTDWISEKAVGEIDRYAGSDKPFFVYVAYTAPHWPLQAPEADIAKYRERYLAGWDVLRERRHQRQIELGIVDRNWPLSPRDPRAQPWDEVKDKAWEANRMATYAAMIDRMDRGVGRIMAELRAKGVADNTLVVFFSDNGACAEVVEPTWYDVPSRTRDGRPIHVGNGDHSVNAGPEDVWQSYGIPWANLSNTPFRLYKHFTHEGGIATPLIASWPAAMTKGGTITRELGHVTDLMATFVDVSGAKHPATYEGRPVRPLEGASLAPVFAGQAPATSRPVFWEHEGNRAVRQGRWKLVATHRGSWELYDTESDRTERNNLAAIHSDKVRELTALYDAWAQRCGVIPPQKLPRASKIVPAAAERTP